MACFGEPVLVINISMFKGSFSDLAHSFHCGKAILCKYCCYVNSVTMATDGNQFYLHVLSTTETKIGVWTLVGQKIITQT